MTRKTGEELNKIQEKYNVNKLWSWSRINCYINSPYEYFLKYILRKPEDRQDCIYGTMGGMAHDIMEKYYGGKIKHKDMIEEFEDAWITAGIAELKFDRNDKEKNKKISEKYYSNLKHFYKNHITIPYKIDLERFITIKIGENVLQGYIDACFKDCDGCFNILDWKTSTIYKGKKALSESGQLIVYAIGLHQLGIPYEKIKIGWNFLKYVMVECEQANGKIAIREIDRSEIGSKLQSNTKMWLNKLGYEDQLMRYLDLLVQTNDIKCLPGDVQEKYKLKDCIVYIDVTQELIDKWTNYIIETIIEIEDKEYNYKNNKDESVFYDSDELIKKQSYYHATLCAYSPTLHKPYKNYLDQIQSNKENSLNIFDGVGLGTNKKEDSKDDDMSWLNQL